MRSNFITNHSLVLYHLVSMDGSRLRNVAHLLDLSERAVQRIVLQLEEQGILKRDKDGRNNLYTIYLDVYCSGFPNPFTVKDILTLYGIKNFVSTDKITFVR